METVFCSKISCKCKPRIEIKANNKNTKGCTNDDFSEKKSTNDEIGSGLQRWLRTGLRKRMTERKGRKKTNKEENFEWVRKGVREKDVLETEI